VLFEVEVRPAEKAALIINVLVQPWTLKGDKFEISQNFTGKRKK